MLGEIILFLVVLFIVGTVVVGAIGVLKDIFDDTVGSIKRKTELHSNIPGRSCLDCVYCDKTRATSRGEIYCKQDKVHYFPEVGHSCEDYRN